MTSNLRKVARVFGLGPTFVIGASRVLLTSAASSLELLLFLFVFQFPFSLHLPPPPHSHPGFVFFSFLFFPLNRL